MEDEIMKKSARRVNYAMIIVGVIVLILVWLTGFLSCYFPVSSLDAEHLKDLESQNKIIQKNAAWYKELVDYTANGNKKIHFLTFDGGNTWWEVGFRGEIFGRTGHSRYCTSLKRANLDYVAYLEAKERLNDRWDSFWDEYDNAEDFGADMETSLRGAPEIQISYDELRYRTNEPTKGGELIICTDYAKDKIGDTTTTGDTSLNVKNKEAAIYDIFGETTNDEEVEKSKKSKASVVQPIE
jgi:hypothetical protein